MNVQLWLDSTTSVVSLRQLVLCLAFSDSFWQMCVCVCVRACVRACVRVCRRKRTLRLALSLSPIDVANSSTSPNPSYLCVLRRSSVDHLPLRLHHILITTVVVVADQRPLLARQRLLRRRRLNAFVQLPSSSPRTCRMVSSAAAW